MEHWLLDSGIGSRKGVGVEISSNMGGKQSILHIEIRVSALCSLSTDREEITGLLSKIRRLFHLCR